MTKNHNSPADWISKSKGTSTVNFRCFVLWRKVLIPRYNPADPPIAAYNSKVRSRIRQFWRIAARLSYQHMIKAVRLMKSR